MKVGDKVWIRQKNPAWPYAQAEYVHWCVIITKIDGNQVTGKTVVFDIEFTADKSMVYSEDRCP